MSTSVKSCWKTFSDPKVSKLVAMGLALWFVSLGLWLLLPAETLYPLYKPGSPINWLPEDGVAAMYLFTGGLTFIGCLKDSTRVAKAGLMTILLLAIFIMMTYFLTLWQSIGVPTYFAVAILASALSVAITKRELEVAFRNND